LEQFLGRDEIVVGSLYVGRVAGITTKTRKIRMFCPNRLIAVVEDADVVEECEAGEVVIDESGGEGVASGEFGVAGFEEVAGFGAVGIEEEVDGFDALVGELERVALDVEGLPCEVEAADTGAEVGMDAVEGE
jgi:hypothetical protein